MIPINEIQAKIYENLSALNIAVYDDVKADATMPFMVIGDYVLNTLEAKCDGYIFEWKLDIFTEYEGKKEVNTIVSDISESIKLIEGLALTDYEVDSVSLENANVYRNEGYYLANVTIKIEIV